eukprot:tig00021440_g21537.t1
MERAAVSMRATVQKDVEDSRRQLGSVKQRVSALYSEEVRKAEKALLSAGAIALLPRQALAEFDWSALEDPEAPKNAETASNSIKRAHSVLLKIRERKSLQEGVLMMATNLGVRLGDKTVRLVKDAFWKLDLAVRALERALEARSAAKAEAAVEAVRAALTGSSAAKEPAAAAGPSACKAAEVEYDVYDSLARVVAEHRRLTLGWPADHEVKDEQAGMLVTLRRRLRDAVAEKVASLQAKFSSFADFKATAAFSDLGEKKRRALEKACEAGRREASGAAARLAALEAGGADPAGNQYLQAIEEAADWVARNGKPTLTPVFERFASSRVAQRATPRPFLHRLEMALRAAASGSPASTQLPPAFAALAEAIAAGVLPKTLAAARQMSKNTYCLAMMLEHVVGEKAMAQVRESIADLAVPERKEAALGALRALLDASAGTAVDAVSGGGKASADGDRALARAAGPALPADGSASTSSATAAAAPELPTAAAAAAPASTSDAAAAASSSLASSSTASAGEDLQMGSRAKDKKNAKHAAAANLPPQSSAVAEASPAASRWPWRELPAWDPRGPDEGALDDDLGDHFDEHSFEGAGGRHGPPRFHDDCPICAIDRLDGPRRDSGPMRRIIASIAKKPHGPFEEHLCFVISVLQRATRQQSESTARLLLDLGMADALRHIALSRHSFVAFYAAHMAEALAPVDDGLRLLRPAAPALARFACQGHAIERMQALRALAAFARAAPDLADEILCRAGPAAAAALVGVTADRLRREAEDAMQAGRYSRYSMEIVTRGGVERKVQQPLCVPPAAAADARQDYMIQIPVLVTAMRREAVAAAARIARQAAASAAEHPASQQAMKAVVPLPPPTPNPADLTKSQLEALAARAVPTQDPLAVAAAGPFDAAALAAAAARLAVDPDFETRWHALSLLRGLVEHPRHGPAVAVHLAESGALAAVAGPALAEGRGLVGELACALAALLRAALAAQPPLAAPLAAWLRADPARLEALRAWAAGAWSPPATPAEPVSRLPVFWVDRRSWLIGGPPPPASARDADWAAGLPAGAAALLEQLRAAAAAEPDAAPLRGPRPAGQEAREPRIKYEPWFKTLEKLKLRRMTAYDAKNGGLFDFSTYWPSPDGLGEMLQGMHSMLERAGVDEAARSECEAGLAGLREYRSNVDRIDREARRCGACGAATEPERLLRCSRCLAVLYCDRECQRAHWKVHKKECKESFAK